MSDFFNNVKPGARVHYMTPQGQTRSGTVVMNRGTHLVLNRGGGQPQVVTKDNYVKHSEGGKVKGALLSKVAKSMKKESVDESMQFFVHKLKQGALVMNDRGDVHDHYEDHEEAQKEAEKLNAKYSKKNVKEEKLDELKTTTLKSYGRKALKDLPKQVKAGNKAWDKYVSGADLPDPDKAYSEIEKADLKVHNRKKGIKRLSKQLADRAKLKPEGERVRAMSLNTEASLEAQKTAIAYETTKKKKKKKKQIVKPGSKHASSARPTNEESTAEIMDRVKKGNERSKALLAKVKKDRERRKYEIHGGSARSSGVSRRGTGSALGTLGIGEAKEDLPFDPDPPKKNPGVVKGKKPIGYSIARHLARKGRDEAEKNITKRLSKEGYDARETEHSGAKKGKGAYYGRKKDAKKESNKARREADKKQCCDEARGVVSGIGIHDDPKRQARVKDVAKRKIIDKIRKAEKDEKTKHGGWTGVHEERIDEIGPFNISKHPAGAKALKVVDKVLNKMQDRADARYQKKQDKIAKERFGKSWTEAGMKAPRKIDPQHQRYPDGSGPSNESADCNFYNRLDEVSKELLSRYVRRAARNAAASAETAGNKFGSTMQAHKSAAKLQYGRPMKFAGKRRALAYDSAEKAERPHIEKTRKRMRGIDRAVSKIAGDPLGSVVAATNEGRESEYGANLALAATARKKPGHYLVRNGQHISGPHDPQGALNKYKDMGDTKGVKIVHIKEANKLQADVKKAGAAVQKAVAAAKAKKKGKTAHTEPELQTPEQATSQPMLQGPEGADQSAA